MENSNLLLNPFGAVGSENRLVHSDIYLRMIDEVQDYAIILLDKLGNIINWNKGAEKIKGYSDREIIGKNFRIFYPDEDRQSKLPERLISDALVNGRANHEGWRVRKDGSRLWANVTITALHDDHNQVIGFVKLTRDLTEKKMAEEQLKQYAADLEKRNHELEQFAYIASHDLQEPMRKIQTFIQLIDKQDPETSKKYLEKINASARRMSALINGILEYSRLTDRQEKWEVTDLNETLNQVKSDFELLIREKNANLISDPLPGIRCMPLQMSQLFANFISNALKFSSGKPVIRICSRLRALEDMLEIMDSPKSATYHELVFEDNGIGFDPQFVDQVFTMFRRLHGYHEYPGTGIGLALCKKIAENHLGFIKVDSELGKGTAFRVFLPVLP
ncbi:MAG TPA: PAS domain S-box protein [Puia sp.]|nr:PAS domain S-box protein [Puia sp.]